MLYRSGVLTVLIMRCHISAARKMFALAPAARIIKNRQVSAYPLMPSPAMGRMHLSKTLCYRTASTTPPGRNTVALSAEVQSSDSPVNAVMSDEAAAVTEKIVQKGDSVRELKSNKADPAAIKAAVADLLDAKAEYKAVTGMDYGAPNASSSGTDAPAKSPKKKQKVRVHRGPIVLLLFLLLNHIISYHIILSSNSSKKVGGVRTHPSLRPGRLELPALIK